jgi:hypothetical protein
MQKLKGLFEKESFFSILPQTRSISLKKRKKLLILRLLHLLGDPALEVLPDPAVLLPEVLVHSGVNLVPGRINWRGKRPTPSSKCALPGTSREIFPFL